MSKINTIGQWREELYWCPSQCYLDIEFEGEKYQIYLRWRWSDPWEASLIINNEWTELEVEYFKDTELAQVKEAAINAADKLLNEKK